MHDINFTNYKKASDKLRKRGSGENMEKEKGEGKWKPENILLPHVLVDQSKVHVMLNDDAKEKNTYAREACRGELWSYITINEVFSSTVLCLLAPSSIFPYFLYQRSLRIVAQGLIKMLTIIKKKKLSSNWKILFRLILWHKCLCNYLEELIKIHLR